MDDGELSGEAVGRERVVRDAAARGLSVRVVERPDAHGLFDAAEKMGIEPSDIVKTLVVKQPGGLYLFALIPGGRKISWPKLRALVGVNKLAAGLYERFDDVFESHFLCDRGNQVHELRDFMFG